MPTNEPTPPTLKTEEDRAAWLQLAAAALANSSTFITDPDRAADEMLAAFHRRCAPPVTVDDSPGPDWTIPDVDATSELARREEVEMNRSLGEALAQGLADNDSVSVEVTDNGPTITATPGGDRGVCPMTTVAIPVSQVRRERRAAVRLAALLFKDGRDWNGPQLVDGALGYAYDEIKKLRGQIRAFRINSEGTEGQ